MKFKKFLLGIPVFLFMIIGMIFASVGEVKVQASSWQTPNSESFEYDDVSYTGIQVGDKWSEGDSMHLYIALDKFVHYADKIYDVIVSNGVETKNANSFGQSRFTLSFTSNSYGIKLYNSIIDDYGFERIISELSYFPDEVFCLEIGDEIAFYYFGIVASPLNENQMYTLTPSRVDFWIEGEVLDNCNPVYSYDCFENLTEVNNLKRDEVSYGSSVIISLQKVLKLINLLK